MISAADVHIFCLLYGDYPRLHRRLLAGLQSSLPKETNVTCWLNQATINFPCDYEFVHSEINVPKYIAMRKMWQDKLNLNHKWFVWFDDDTKIIDPDWFNKTINQINHFEKEDISYVGQLWISPYLQGQEDFIKESSWYREKPLRIINGFPSSRFAQGAYWWIRKDVVVALDWPDSRLEHNGGDSLLGEAIYQNDIPFHKLPKGCFGVKPNRAVRRGLDQIPAGCTDKIIIHKKQVTSGDNRF